MKDFRKKLKNSYIQSMDSLFGKNFAQWLAQQANPDRLKDCSNYKAYIERNAEIKALNMVADHIRTMMKGGDEVCIGNEEENFSFFDFQKLIR